MATDTNRNRIKVLFFDEAVAFGGSVVVLAHLFNHIDRTRFKPLLVTSLDESSLRLLFRPGDVLSWLRPTLTYASRARWMNICPGKSKLAQRLWAYLFTVSAYCVNLPTYVSLLFKIVAAKPDIVHFNNGNDGVKIAQLLGTPVVWHLHGFTDESAKWTKVANRHRWSTVSISRFISNEAIRHGADPAFIVDVPNPIPTVTPSLLTRHEWLTRYGISDDAIVLSHVGRVVRWKGQLEFLRAFAVIADECPKAIALIVGDDVEELNSEYPVRLKNFVAENALESRVKFTGHVSAVLELMSFSTVVVHSSIEPEPFGLVITEAMAVETAVIAARLGAPMEIIEDGVSGVLVDPSNTSEFAAGLKVLICDESRRKQIARAGREMAERRYSPQAFATSMAEVYESALRRKHGAVVSSDQKLSSQ